MNYKRFITISGCLLSLVMAHQVCAEEGDFPKYTGDAFDASADVKKQHIDFFETFEEEPMFMRYYLTEDDLNCEKYHIPYKYFLEVDALEITSDQEKYGLEDGVANKYFVDYQGDLTYSALNRIQKKVAPDKNILSSADRGKGKGIELYVQKIVDSHPLSLLDGQSLAGFTLAEEREFLETARKVYAPKLCFDNGGYASLLFTYPRIKYSEDQVMYYSDGWNFVTVKDGKELKAGNLVEDADEVDAYLRGLAYYMDYPRIVRDDYSVKYAPVLMAQDGVYVMVKPDDGSATQNAISVRIPQTLLKEEVQLVYQEPVAAYTLEDSLTESAAYDRYSKEINQSSLDKLQRDGERMYLSLGKPDKVYTWNGSGLQDNTIFTKKGIEDLYFLQIPSIIEETGLTVEADGALNYLISEEDPENENYQAIEKLTKDNVKKANTLVLTRDDQPIKYDSIEANTISAALKNGSKYYSKELVSCKGDGSLGRQGISKAVSQARDEYTPIITYDRDGYTSIVCGGPLVARHDYDIKYNSQWIFKTFKDGEEAAISDVVFDIEALQLYLIGLAKEPGMSDSLYLSSDFGPNNTNWFMTDEGVFLQIGQEAMSSSQLAVVIPVPIPLLTKELQRQYLNIEEEHTGLPMRNIGIAVAGVILFAGIYIKFIRKGGK